MMVEYSCIQNTELTPTINGVVSNIQETQNCSPIHGLLNENLLLNERLLNSIDLVNAQLLAQVTGVSAFTPYIPLVSVLLGACAAYGFTRYHWCYSETKKKESEFVDRISTLVSEIEKISVTYWLADFNKKDVENEVLIKSKIRLLTKYVRLISDKNKSLKEALLDFQSHIFDQVTGDDFESTKRKASKTKAINISYLCGDINGTLSRHR